MKWMLIVALVLVGCGNSDVSKDLDPFINFNTTDGSSDLQDMGVPDAQIFDVPPQEDMAPDVPPQDMPVEVDILDQLLAADHVEDVAELRSESGFRRFVIRFRQPLDHFEDDGRSFPQDALLWHRDSSMPMVLVTTGYGLGEPSDYAGFYVEPTQMLNANQMFLGHRFFAGALPDAQDQEWSKVNIQQAAADNHNIVSSLRSIYDSAWIGTGWSKGGMTTIFHEYFHPDDLDLALPMVAPISLGKQDGRYPPFLAQIGTTECRDRLDQSMLGALDRLDEIVDVFGPLSPSERTYYRAVTKQQIVSIPWSFWQFLGYNACNDIPDSTIATPEALAYFFLYLEIVPSLTAPRPIRPDEAPLIAYSYQAATELGYQDIFPSGHLDRLQQLGHLTNEERAEYETPFEERPGVDTPWETLPPFNAQSMIDVDTWLRNEATDMVAVYGEYDPWTGGRITLDAANNSEVLTAPRASHGAFLQDLSPSDLDRVTQRILQFAPPSFGARIVPQVRIDREKVHQLLRKRLL